METVNAAEKSDNLVTTITGLIGRIQSLEAENRELKSAIREFLECKDQDCTCRQGPGLCNQCRENAIYLITTINAGEFQSM